MSKIGKRPIELPDGVSIEIKGESLEVKGKVTLSVRILPGVKVEVKDKEVLFVPGGSTKQILSNWGTMRALTANAVKGVSEEFVKELIIEGVGYRAEVQGDKLVLNVGFSHQVNFSIPIGTKVVVEKNNIKVSGADKELVGETAAKIRRIKKPEPYKGKGIMYKGEVVRRKAGKKAVSST
jgi:large subunit ribosomal protein L6